MRHTPFIAGHWLAVVLLMLGLASSVDAQSYVWNNTTGNWSTAANWTPGSVPTSAAATVLNFGSGAADYTTTYNAGTGGLPSSFNLNSLQLAADVGRTDVLTAAAQTNTLNFLANGATQPTIGVSGGGTWRIANNVKVGASANLTMNVASGSSLVFSTAATPGGTADHVINSVSGSSTMTIEGGGTVVARTITLANVVVNNGLLITDANGDFFGSSTTLTVGASGIVDTGGFGEGWNAFQGSAGGIFRGLVSVTATSGSYTYDGIITDRPAGVTVPGFGLVGTTTAATLVGAVTKAGGHTLTLTGASTYTGVTSITGGILSVSQLANGGVASSIGAASSAPANLSINGGTLQYTGADVATNRQFTVGSSGATIEVINANATLTVNSTYAANNTTMTNSLSGGSGVSLTKTGPGRLTLTGDNSTFTGAIVVNGGYLRISDPGNGTGSNGDIGTTSFTVNNGGTFEFFGPTGNPDLVDTATVTINTGGTAIFTEGESYGAILLNGGAFNSNVSSSLGSTSILQSGTLNNINGTNGTLAGAGLIRKTTADTVTVTGVALNSTSGVAIEQGMLSTDTSIGGATGNVTLGTTGTGATSGTLQYRGATATMAKPIVLNDGGGTIDVSTTATTYTLSAAITGSGSLTKSGSGTLALTATNAYSGGTTISGGTLQIGNSTATGTITGTVVNNATLAFKRSNDDTFDIAVSGSGGVNKLNTNTITLSGLLTYTGPTSIGAGVLRITPTTLPGGISVASASGLTVLNGTHSGTLTTSTLSLADTSTLLFDMSLPGNPTAALLNVTGTDGITLAGTATLKVTNSQSFSVGTFTIIDYTGNPITSGFTLAPLPARTIGQLVYNTNNTSIDLNVTGVDTIVWTGVNNTTWDAGTAVDADGTFNWKLASTGTATNFVAGDVIRFDDSASVRDINLTSALAPTAITVDTADSYSFGGSGSITGSTSLTKTGSGTLTILTNNDYTGTTTISNGVLHIGNGTSTGSIGTGALVNNGSVIFDRSDNISLAMPISGTGSLTKTGSNTLTLIGTYTMTGDTSLEAGKLILNTAADYTYSGSISGGGGLTKSGTGTLTLGGSNTYAGATALTAGTLILTGSNTNAGGLTLSASTTLRVGNGGTGGSLSGAVVNPATVSFNRSDDSAFDGAISGAGTVSKLGAGTLIMSGANTYTGATTLTGGTLQIGDGVSTATTFTSNVAAGAGTTLAFNLGADLAYTKVMSGTGAVTKNGPGTLTLTGDNTNTGTLTINGGLVIMADPTLGAGTGGALATATIVVNNGGGFQFGTQSTLGGSSENPDLPSNTYITVNTGGTVEWRIGESLGGINLQGGTLVLNGGNPGGGGSTNQLWSAGVVNGLQANTVSGNPITKSTSGTVTVQGLAVIGVATTIQDGTVVLTSASNLGTAAYTFGTAGTGGTTGTLEYQGETASRGGAFTLTGSGVIRVTDPAAALTLTGVVSGAGNLMKESSGKLQLNGVNTFTGSTTVSAGTLALGGSGSIAKSPLITVAAGATLDGSSAVTGGNSYDATNLRFRLTSGQTLRGLGTIAADPIAGGALTVSSGAILDPGVGSIGTLTVAGSLGFETGSTLMIRLTGGVPVSDVVASAGLSSGGTLLNPANNTFLNVATSSLTFADGVNLKIDGTTAGLVPGQHYSFAIANGSVMNLGSTPQFSTVGFTASDFSLTTDGNVAYLSFMTTAVPEPFLLLTFAAVLLGLGRANRIGKKAAIH